MTFDSGFFGDTRVLVAFYALDTLDRLRIGYVYISPGIVCDKNHHSRREPSYLGYRTVYSTYTVANHADRKPAPPYHRRGSSYALLA